MKVSGKHSEAGEFHSGPRGGGWGEDGWQKARVNLRVDIVIAQLWPSETQNLTLTMVD